MAEGTDERAVCIEIAVRPDREDSRARRILAAAREAGLPLPDGLTTRRGFSLRIAGGLAAARRLADELLADPVMDVARVLPAEQSPCEPDSRRLEIARRAGVMDPVAQSVQRAAAALGLAVRDVRTFSAVVAPPDTEPELLLRLGRTVLANEVVEELAVDPPRCVPPAPELPDRPFALVTVPVRRAAGDELLRISREGSLALDEVEMAAIAEHFRGEGREPTDIELETLAQTWSEHCKHKTLTGRIDYDGETIDNLLKQTIVAATRALARDDFAVSVFVDNAGVIAFDEQHLLTMKVETHNHPSALEPYGGAGTGLGGVLRDTLGTGLGARPVASTDVFCFGPPDLPDEQVPKGSLPPRRVMKGVVAGVRDYGNRMGIPTVNGAVWFDPRYVANPLVYCGSIGLLPRDRLVKEVRPGDLVVLCGGATGRDGIHGATFSSQELHEESESLSSGAVQIGNAIEEKRLHDALLTARDRGLYRSVTDCGAGGLSSAVGEMGESTGAHVDLHLVPLKYHGLTYTEVWISEAQERMVLAVPPEHEDALLAVFAAEDVPATVIGRFTDTGRLTADWHGTRVMDLSMAFLHDGLPRQTRPATRAVRRCSDPPPLPRERAGEMLLRLLAAPNVASKHWIVRQYDHEVQAGSVVKPMVGPARSGPSDGAVVAPVLGSRRAFALGVGLAPWMGDVDCYRMALAVVDEALRNVVALGGDPGQTAILDNFSWGRCDKPENLGDLVEACRGCHDAALAFGTPFISGKDSLNNDYRVEGESRSIPPTLLVSALAIVHDVSHATTMDLVAPGHRLLLVGSTGPELGGSHLARLSGERGQQAPLVDLSLAPRILAAVHRLLVAGHVHACHDLSEGGLAVAAAEMAFAGGVGAELDVAALPVRGEVALDRRLFGESPSRFLLEVAEDALPAVVGELGDLPHAVLGRTLAEPRLRVREGAATVIDLPLADLSAAFLRTLDLDHEHDPAGGSP